MTMDKKHLSFEEIIAIVEGDFELLNEWRNHFSECPECTSLKDNYLFSKGTFLEMRYYDIKVSDEIIDSLSEKSFNYISSNEATKRNHSS